MKKLISTALSAVLAAAMAGSAMGLDMPGIPAMDFISETAVTAKAAGMQKLTDCVFDYAEEFSNGYAFAVKGNDWGYVDANGNFQALYQLPDDLKKSYFEYFTSGGVYNKLPASPEGLVPYYQSGKWGYYNLKTKQVAIQPQYSNAVPFHSGRACVKIDETIKSTQPGYNAQSIVTTYKVIDTTGKTVFTPGSIYGGIYQEGLLVVNNKDSYTYDLVDINGKTLISNVADGAGGAGSIYGYAAVGGIDLDYTKDLNAIVVQRSSYTDGNMLSSYSVYNKQGGLRFTNSNIQYLSMFSEGMAYYKKSQQDNLIGIINADGQILTQQIFTGASFFNEGYAWVTTQDGKYGYVDKTGKFVIQPIYDGASLFRNGVASVKKDNKWGLIDKTGKTVLNFQFDYLAPGEDGTLAYLSGDKYGFMAQDGTKYTEAVYDNAWFPVGNTVMVYQNGKYGFLKKV